MKLPLQSLHQVDFLTREILFTHDPDNRWLDSHLLLNLVERVFCCTSDNVSDPPQLDATRISEIDLIGLSDEPISLIIYKISNEIFSLRFEDENLHRKTIFLLEILSHYKWDAKLVLALASFATKFGVFWLVLLLQSENALADSLAIVKRLPKSIDVLKPKFKALNSLVNSMLNLTKLVIRFEVMYVHHELADNNAMDITKYSDKTVIAAWELLSLGKKLNSLSRDLGECVDQCQHQIETRLYEKLLRMFKEDEVDNQNALRILLASENEFPLKNPSSGEKSGVLDLKNKVVILLISKPELLPIDKIFLLVQHMTRNEGSYEIVWLPMYSKWSVDDVASFEFLSSRLPWLFIRRPWSINPTVVNYIKQEWGFKEDPMMVVLNEKGVVVNSNAMDMVWIWGKKAFPFSSSREKELRENENWTLNFMINGIDSLSSELGEEGKNICIYGSDNLEWIREFNSKTKKIKSTIVGNIQFEAIYVGCKNPGENVKDIIETVSQENLSATLTFDKVRLFWFRLEAIKRCNFSGKIGDEVAKLLDSNSNFGWAVIGRGSFSTDVMKLDRERVEEWFDKFPLWCKNVEETGLVEPPLDGGKCNYHELVAYEEGSIEKIMICGSCKRPIDKFVVYKCDE
ncbi:hypothetical protein MIMGU_mgv1a026947mg [Erythranthe guttata]|uniref:Sieve element occlusion C-terminal domain-containing protein n=1 Tax=Erythranthe guttata TaxID=4155 RepID=A0A022Q7P8_ERYGU|nr:hypothetical protein MIMGU_mgv1a026947mg [Erythranthe guttata]